MIDMIEIRSAGPSRRIDPIRLPRTHKITTFNKIPEWKNGTAQ
jgi:hypothetical protein